MDRGFTKAMGYGHPAGPGLDPGFGEALAAWLGLLEDDPLAGDPTAHFTAWTRANVLRHNELLGRTPTPKELSALESELDRLDEPESVLRMLLPVGGGGFVVVPPSASLRWVRHNDDVDYVSALAASPDGRSFAVSDASLPGYPGRQDARGRDAADGPEPGPGPGTSLTADRAGASLASADAYPGHHPGDHPLVPLVVESYLLWSGLCRDGGHVHATIRPAVATFWMRDSSEYGNFSAMMQE